MNQRLNKSKFTNKNQKLKNANICMYQTPPSSCSGIFPKSDSPSPSPSPTILKVETYQYTTISDGIKRVYTNQDGIAAYDSSKILDPSKVSYINLFINGILQPPINYVVTPGTLRLTTNDLPYSGTIIILQFVIVYGN